MTRYVYLFAVLWGSLLAAGCGNVPNMSPPDLAMAPHDLAIAPSDLASSPDLLPACVIAGKVYAPGAVNPQQPCQTCQPGASKTDWTTDAAGTVCGAACVHLMTDVNNCGACSHVCGCDADSCTGGQCDPRVLAGAGASAVQNPLILDATNAYWMERQAVKKVPLTGGAATILAMGSGTDVFFAMAVDANNAYWTNDLQTGVVSKVPLAGGGPTALNTGGFAALGIAIDANNVYWANSSSIMKIAKAGGAAAAVASGVSGGSLASDGTFLYSTFQVPTSGKIQKTPIAGGSPVDFATGQDYPGDIMVYGANLYWVNLGAGNSYVGSVMKLPLAGGTPTAIATGQGYPSAIDTDGTNLYWANLRGNTVMKAPLAGGAATQVVSASAPAAVRVDAQCVYFIDAKGLRKAPK